LARKILVKYDNKTVIQGIAIMSRYLLAIDQGTTSSRAIVFDLDGHIIATSQQEFPQIFPQDGWVEHDPEAIWQSTEETCREAIKKASLNASDILSIGITNQRETTVVWDKETGKPVYNAIVWQDRRTADLCQELRKQEGLVEKLTAKTGLLLDPYFSASKIEWILDNVEGARSRAEAGELLFGTIDTFLLWRLTGGEQHATDATNASRTLLFNIHTNEWDEELLQLFNVPASLLPEVRDCAADYGKTKADLFGDEIAIGGIAGDQQAALIGQACFTPGMAKSTYGTGCFMIMNTGDQALQSKNRLLTTIGYRVNGKTSYALEGSIFMAGATIQWIRDGLQLISNAKETQSLAEQTGADNSVYMVPAFTGLGAPYWDPEARGAIFGLSRDTGIKEIVTAGLQSVCYQTRDLLQAMSQDGASPASIRVDGGMVVNDWLVQFLADTLGVVIERPQVTETTALGVAYLAGLQAGAFESLEQVAKLWHNEAKFEPQMSTQDRERLYAGWLEAVGKVLGNK
jgi:glycerol kinase